MVRIKARAVENKAWQRLDPAGGRWGLFGLHTVPERAVEVVVTEVRLEDGGNGLFLFVLAGALPLA